MRYSDLEVIRPDQLDFVPRERERQIRTIIIAFVLTIAFVFIAGYAPLFRGMEAYAPLATIGALAILCFYVAYQAQKNLDLVMSTEHQNMLFAQSFSLGTSFAMIVRRDGTIVHASDSMGTMFPQFDYAQSQALEGLFEEGTVRRVDRERIMGAIHSASNERLIFPIITRYQEKKDYIISVEPMERPAGYCLIRGREYLGQRSGLQRMPDSLRSTSIDKLDHLLTTADVSLYTTDSFGSFEFVNPAFEAMFGYKPGEIVASKLGVSHLVFSLGGTLVTEEYSLHDYVGEASLVLKSGARVNAYIKQSLIRDAAEKSVGAVGLVHLPNAR